MKSFRTTITAMDGHQLSVRIYEPDDHPIGHIHLLHGMAEHIERYDEFAIYLTNLGYFVSGHDHRGHGETVKLNGTIGFFAEIDGFERVTLDAYEVISSIRKNYVITAKLIVIGHSMGSFIARRFMQRFGEDLSKVVLIGTRNHEPVSGGMGMKIAGISAKMHGKETPNRLLNFLSFGNYNSNIKNALTPFDWLSTDAVEVDKYMQDPYCGFVGSNQFFNDLLSGMSIIHRQKEIEKIPKSLAVLLLSGTEDPVGRYGKDVWKVAAAYEKVGIHHVKVQLFENRRHELLHEVDKEDVFQVIEQWLKE